MKIYDTVIAEIARLKTLPRPIAYGQFLTVCEEIDALQYDCHVIKRKWAKEMEKNNRETMEKTLGLED